MYVISLNDVAPPIVLSETRVKLSCHSGIILSISLQNCSTGKQEENHQHFASTNISFVHQTYTWNQSVAHMNMQSNISLYSRENNHSNIIIDVELFLQKPSHQFTCGRDLVRKCLLFRDLTQTWSCNNSACLTFAHYSKT